MRLHDTHVHLDLLLKQLNIVKELDRYGSCSEGMFDKRVLDALLNKHDWVIQATLNSNNYVCSKELFHYSEKIYYLFGLHPQEVTKLRSFDHAIQTQLSTLEQEKNYKKLVGIGEVGLDYCHTSDSDTHLLQKKVFIAHLELAQQYQLPVVVHVRDARGEEKCMKDMLDILRNHTPQNGFLVHCFTGTEEHAESILSLGGLLGFGGIITFPSGIAIQQIASRIPGNTYVLETDLPFLSPTPKRSEVCLPEYIQYIAQEMASARNKDVDTILQESYSNSYSLFSRLGTTFHSI